MICKKCGANVFDGIKFCPNCGETLIEDAVPTPVEQPMIQPQPVQPIMQPQPTPVGMPNNNGMYMPPQNNDNKGNSGLVLVIIGIVVALVACVVIIALNGKKNNPGNSNSNSNVTSTQNSNSNSNVESNPTSTITSNPTSTVTSNPSAKTVTFSGYVLTIPTSYDVKYVGTQLQLYGTNKKDVAVITIQEGNYATIKSNLSSINTYIGNSGYTVTKGASAVTLGGVEYLYLTVKKDTQNMIMAYAKLDNNHIFLIVLGNTDSTVDYTKLQEFSNTILTAKKA